MRDRNNGTNPRGKGRRKKERKINKCIVSWEIDGRGRMPLSTDRSDSKKLNKESKLRVPERTQEQR